MRKRKSKIAREIASMEKLCAQSSESNESKRKEKQNEVKNGALATESTDIDLQKLIVRQQEACSVIEQKKSALVAYQLSYLEYIELQEEIGRLNSLRDSFQAKINALRKQRKKNESNTNR